MCAHSGWESVVHRYSFSHTNSIASFQFLRLSSSIPPSFFLEWRVSSTKHGCLLFPHMNSLINFIRAFLVGAQECATQPFERKGYVILCSYL